MAVLRRLHAECAAHTQFKVGGQVQRVDALFDLGVFRAGPNRVRQDFPAFDRNGDGQVNDDDLLFAVTLRSGKPNQDLVIPDANNVHLAGYAQDDWRVHPRLTLNLGMRYEIDTDVNNISRVRRTQPDREPFCRATRHRDTNNFAPRIGFNWATADGAHQHRGGYGIYYDRITLEIESLERGLDGRALPIEVRAGNVFFIDPGTGQFPPFAPITSNPFTGFILPGAGASGINIIDNRMQNPMVQQFSLGVERQLGKSLVVRVNVLHAHGTQFIIGRTVGKCSIRSSAVPTASSTSSRARKRTTTRCSSAPSGATPAVRLRVSYTLSKALNYANDDQIPFSNGPIDPNDLRARVRPDARTTSGIASRRRTWSHAVRQFQSRRCGRSRRACRWTS